jgi:iron complex outermembrane recepter protein
MSPCITTRVAALWSVSSLVLGFVLASATPATAQSTATLNVTVVDQSDAALPNATLTLTNAETMVERRGATSEEGNAGFPLLPPGRYVIRAEHPGFTPAEVGDVAVQIDDRVAIRIQLKVESLSENVVVTAQKRAERPQDVPVPVTVLDADRLVETGQLRLRDYYNTIPSFHLVGLYGFRQTISIRGITTGGFSNPTVGITVDDIPYGASTSNAGSNNIPDVDPGDLSTIEVLRGPQGTLYGASSMGGLIKYVTKDPTSDRVAGTIQLGSTSVHNGDGPGYNLRGSLNLPVTRTLAMRIGGYTRQEPGYISNPILARDAVNDIRSRGGQLSAVWRRSPSWSVKLNALYQNTIADGLGDAHVLPGLGDLDQNYMPDTGRSDITVQTYGATLGANLGRAELTAITGYNLNKYANQYDRSAQQGPTVAQSTFGVGGMIGFDFNSIKRLTQELRVATSLGSRVQWMAGLFYSHEDSNGGQQFFAADRPTGRVVGLSWTRLTPYTLQEVAGFTNVTLRLTDRFDVQLGGRQSHNIEDDGDYVQSGPWVGDVPVVQPPLHSQSNTFNYLITPRFKPSPDLMIYGRLASGYRVGGPNFFVAGAPSSYEPDTTQNYEVGVKGEFLDRRLSLDLSMFYIDWSNLQISLRNATGFTYLTNGSKAKSQGTEITVASRLTRGLSIRGWLAYNDAVLTEALPAGPVYGISGDRLPNSARVSGNASVEQEFPLSARTIGFVGVTVTHTGDRVSLFTATAVRERFPAYNRADLRAGVRHGFWRADLFVNNLTDERGVLAGGIGYQPTFAFVYIQPRTIGLSVSRSF